MSNVSDQFGVVCRPKGFEFHTSSEALGRTVDVASVHRGAPPTPSPESRMAGGAPRG